MVLVVQLAFAQEKIISGTITDNNGMPLPGVNILIQNTNIGTQSDFDGKYNIKTNKGAVLVFSYVGFSKKTIVVNESNTINVALEEDAAQLEEVVVTALGVKSKPRSLSYAVQTVTADDIANTGETNITTSLASKAAGVSVVSSSGSVGASANIRIRGNTSINRTNSPLFVVDGIPIDNSSSGNATGGTDNSNRAIDLNQNDIESINILKGVAAQTLYGLRAANGVVLITTKKGKSGTPTVTVSSNLAFSEVNGFPDLQKQFAQGRSVGGVPTYRGPETGEGFSWGPAISSLEFDGDSSYDFDRNGRLVPLGTGNGRSAVAYDNLTFFKTGISTDLNVSVRGGTEKVRYYVSGGKLDQTGTAPTEEFGRTSFRANIEAELAKKLTLNANGNYVKSGGRRVQRGSNISGIMLGLLRTTPTFDNGNGLTGTDAANTPSTYTNPDGSQRSYRAGIYDNPYWTVAKNPSFDDVHRFIGSFALDYKATDWLSIRGSYGYDRYTDTRKSGIDIGSAADAGGQVIDTDISNEDINSQLLFIINKNFGEKLTFGSTFGVNQFKTEFSQRQTTGFGLTIPGFFHVSNSASQTNTETINRRELRGALANVTLGYDDMLFFNGSFRNDWSSTLPEDDNSFQSYGVGGSFIFTELMNEDLFLNYGKLRASWGKSGNDASTFATITYYNPGSAGGDGFIDNNIFPLFSSVAFERSGQLGNSNIRPETTTEFEIGTELKFFKSRLSLDVAYYNKETKDQIISVNQPATTGYTNRVINAGVISNKGWEITAGITPIKTNDFNWNIDLNWTKYENVVEELVEGIEPIFLQGGGFNSTSSRAVEGFQYGAIYGSRWLRDDNGNILVDDNGWGIVDPENGVVGDPNPDWTLGIRNNVSYKNFTLSALLDIRQGGDVWCGTCGILDYFGVSEITGELRNQTFVFEGVRQSDGQPNTTEVQYVDPAGDLGDNRWVRYGFGGVSEDNVHDASFVKLREVSLTYSLPDNFLDSTFLSSASLTLSGRNLLVITDYPGIDPETNLSGDSNGFGLDYFNQPNTRSYSVALKLTF